MINFPPAQAEDLVLFFPGQATAELVRGSPLPDLVLKEPEVTLYLRGIPGVDPVGKSLAPLSEGPADGLSLGLPGYACYFGGEVFDFLVLDVERHS